MILVLCQENGRTVPSTVRFSPYSRQQRGKAVLSNLRGIFYEKRAFIKKHRYR